jgi:hypothetical protein
MIMHRALNIITAIMLVAIGLGGLGALDWMQAIKP